jgi:S-adenosylmethionine-diacylglycerol 3-amino-3-carboxypropyl transferase
VPPLPLHSNPVQFAVVREDPEIEARLIREHDLRSALLIASGGCTAFSLLSEFPGLELTLLDANPAQLALVREKARLLRDSPAPLPGELRRRFGVGTDDPAALTAGGNFESLFRGLRRFIHEFMLAPAELERLVGEAGPADRLEALFAHKYWPVAFALYFSDPILGAMFGPAATQHAPPGSYPAYFRQALERGLRRPDAHRNYFLHHILLGRYLDRDDCLPRYLAQPPRRLEFREIEAGIEELADPERHELISLSNLFDWLDETAVARVAALLRERMRPGSWVVFRQLNHAKDFRRHFGGDFTFASELESELWSADRSLFYARLNIARRG